MFDPKNKRIASKEHEWHWVKRGVFAQLHFDLETSGLDRRGSPHAIRGYPFITEWGDALADLAGNHYDSLQIFPRRPERLMPDPAAPIVQRLADGALDYDSESRVPYFDAMARIMWRVEHAAHQYEKIYTEREQVTFSDVNKQARGPRDCEETVVPLPMLDEKGQTVHHVRYHPGRKRLAYRFEESPSSPYYERVENLYYVDRKDGSKWKWVEPKLAIMGFNVQSYDVPVFRVNMARAGVHPSNIPFLYSRATVTNKQRQKNYLVDVRNTALLVALHGRQGEDALRLGQKIDQETGRLFTSEALAGYLETNKRFENVIRNVSGGVFMPHNGSVHDPAADHGAAYDAIGSLALRNHAVDNAPRIVSVAERQSDEDEWRRMLTAQDYRGERLPLFSYPRRSYLSPQSDSLYLFLDTDDQMGRFKKAVLLHVDGAFHKREYEGRPLHKLTPEQWVDYIEKTRSDPDAPVRLEPFRRWKGAISLDTVLESSSAAGRYRGALEGAGDDVVYLNQNPEMLANIRAAVGEINRRQRFRPGTQNPVMEDEWPRHGFGDVYFQEDRIAAERARLAQQLPGPRPPAGPLETIKERMQDDVNYMNMVDEGLMRLFVTAHPIDSADRKKNPAEDAEVLDNFNDLVRRAWSKFREKKVPYLSILHDHMDDYFPRRGKKKTGFETIAEARKFRDALRKRALEDYLEATRDPKSEYAQGFIDRDVFFRKRGRPHLLLFANIDRGENGAVPQIVDESRRILPADYLEKQEPRVVRDMLGSRRWTFRFHRLRSEPIIETVMHHCTDNGKHAGLPDGWLPLYEDRKRLRLDGPPTETSDTARHATRATFLHDQQRLEINANSRDPALLEREMRTGLGLAARLVRADEGQRALAGNRTFIEKSLRNDPPRPLKPYEGTVAYDNIPYEIPKNGHVILDVPAWHLRHPIRQFDVRLPANCLVLERPAEDVVRQIRAGVPVILREAETGRMYHTGPASLHPAPKANDESFALLNDSAERAYRQAGTDFPQRRVVLGIEGLYPLAATRRIDASAQSLKVPHLHFDGFVYAPISGFEKTLNGIVLPVDYCPQPLEAGAKTRLREMSGHMFDNIDGKAGRDTGHVYEATLAGVIGINKGRKEGITLRQLFRDAGSGKIGEKVLDGCGFLGAEHMQERLHAWARERWSDEFLGERVLVASFDKVRKSTWAYYNPPEAPMAALLRRGQEHVPPSAYQDIRTRE